MRQVLIVIAVAVLVAAGCGGGGGKRLSRDQYASQANAICADFNGKIKGLGNPGTTLPQLAAYTKKALPIFKDGVGRLKKLKPPKAEDDLAKRWIGLADQQVDFIKKIGDAAGDGDEAKVRDIGNQASKNDKALNTLSRELGADTCAES